jgi:hypothetical protein
MLSESCTISYRKPGYVTDWRSARANYESIFMLIMRTRVLSSSLLISCGSVSWSLSIFVISARDRVGA